MLRRIFGVADRRRGTARRVRVRRRRQRRQRAQPARPGDRTVAPAAARRASRRRRWRRTGSAPSPTAGCSSTCPADWPVYDLAADPSTCVRFDVHAVYLGHPGADMNCPADLVGRADAVLVEPTDGGSTPRSRRSVGRRRRRDRERARRRRWPTESAARPARSPPTLPSAGVSVTLTYQESDATAQQILQSFRVATR